MSSTGASAPLATTSTTTAQAAPMPPRLLILAPRARVHAAPTLTVRLALRGAQIPGTPSFRYRLDGGRPRTSGARFTLHNLAPGRHRLQVALAGATGVSAVTSFVVRAPALAPAPTVTTTATATSTPIPPSAGSAPAPVVTHTQTSTPAPTHTAAPQPAPGNGIPQGNGGDMDADNNGGPSDGDGNI